MGAFNRAPFPGTMEAIQKAIESSVKDYRALFPGEFAAFKTAMRQKRAQTFNKFAEVKGTDTEMRALYEIPETLQTMFTKYLDEESKKYMESKDGARWFARHFSDFAIAEVV